MNLVAGTTIYPVLAGFNTSLTRPEDVAHQMEAVGWDNLAVVLRRNLAISWGLHAVDALLLALCVREVQNFELGEQERAAEEVPAQDQVVEEEWDCFGVLIAK